MSSGASLHASRSASKAHSRKPLLDWRNCAQARHDAPPVDALRRPARQRLAEPRRPRRRREPAPDALRARRRRARGQASGGEAPMWPLRQAGPRGRRGLHDGTPHGHANDAEPGTRPRLQKLGCEKQIWGDAPPQSFAVPELAGGPPSVDGKTGPRERARRPRPGASARRVLERAARLVRRRRFISAGPVPVALCG